MRSPAARSLRSLAVLCLAAVAPWAASADTIYLKNGNKIIASHVIQENGQVSYETSAGHLSFPASIVDKVVHDAGSPDSTAGTPLDRAANLPIAPPNALAPPASDEAARAAIRDGEFNRSEEHT